MYTLQWEQRYLACANTSLNHGARHLMVPMPPTGLRAGGLSTLRNRSGSGFPISDGVAHLQATGLALQTVARTYTSTFHDAAHAGFRARENSAGFGLQIVHSVAITVRTGIDEEGSSCGV